MELTMSNIRFTTKNTSLGWMLVAFRENGICSLTFADHETAAIEELQARFSSQSISRGTKEEAAEVNRIADEVEQRGELSSIDLNLDATEFRRRVWSALQQIPIGETRTYSEIAEEIGQPTAARAVANACANNPLAVVIPCHRVVRNDGGLGGYRWGLERKRELLRREATRKAS